MGEAQNFSRIDFLSRLLVADMSFLTLREKLLFQKFLLSDDDGNPFENEKSFTERFLSLTIDNVSLCVQRVFKRVKWNPREALRVILLSEKIIQAQSIKSTCVLDSDFPAMLREMKDPPFLLFYRGNLEILNRKCVSVVGTRKASQKALRSAQEFSREACDDGLCVVSGLAFGIDAASHKGALLSQMPATCAVLPSGIDMITPKTHTRLAAKILEKGGLIMSEYLPGTPSVQFRYVQRNRIVAALSPATLVVQAPAGSGAMITAGLALDYNREVLFHSECFSKEAIELNQISVLQWKKTLEKDKKVEYKMSDTPQSFVDDGAKVISDYGEFKKVLADLPFKVEDGSKSESQNTLFD